MAKSLTRLKASANEHAVWRGHTLGKWTGQTHLTASALCIHCDMQIAVNARPLPNDIEIGGEAVALNCK